MATNLLVVAATDHELAPADGWLRLRCGVGPVDAAAATAAAIAQRRPRIVLHVGIAGARRAAALAPPALVIGVETIYCDLGGVSDEWAPRRLPAPAQLVEAASRALPDAVRRAIGTSGRVGASSGCDIEAMEGFAVLRAAALAGVPAIEVRAISNEIEESDRARWELAKAFAAIRDATPRLVLELATCAS